MRSVSTKSQNSEEFTGTANARPDNMVVAEDYFGDADIDATYSFGPPSGAENASEAFTFMLGDTGEEFVGGAMVADNEVTPLGNSSEDILLESVSYVIPEQEPYFDTDNFLESDSGSSETGLLHLDALDALDALEAFMESPESSVDLDSLFDTVGVASGQQSSNVAAEDIFWNNNDAASDDGPLDIASTVFTELETANALDHLFEQMTVADQS